MQGKSRSVGVCHVLCPPKTSWFNLDPPDDSHRSLAFQGPLSSAGSSRHDERTAEPLAGESLSLDGEH